MPDPRVETAIDLAKRLNTYNQADRSAQYKDASLPALLRSHNEQWKQIREERESLKLKLWIVSSALAGCWALVLVLVELLLRG